MPEVLSMDDWISRSELLKNYGLGDAVKYGNKSAEQQYHSYSTLMLYEIADMIREAPAVSCWIPCNEKLPEIDAEVLVTLYKPELGGCFRKIGRFIGTKWLINNIYAASRENVIAWMPLPDAYKPPETEANSDV